MGWHRARQPEQKEQRRVAILSAATELFDTLGLDGTSLSAIARESGLSKANLYRYFESREAILLEVAAAEQALWVADLESRLAPLAGSDDLESLAAACARSLTVRPRFCTLLPVIPTVLEHNMTVEGVAEYKARSAPLLVRVANAIHAAVPSLGMPEVLEFMRFVYLSAGATWAAANPPPNVAAVLCRAEFAMMAVDFEASMKRHAMVLLQGLTAG